MFSFQQAQTGASNDFAALGLGERSRPFSLFGAQANALKLRDRVQLFDLQLVAVEVDEAIQMSFHFRKDAFSAATISRMAERYLCLIAKVIEDPGIRIKNLPLLDDLERRLVLEAWNATTASYASESLLHELFSARASACPEAIALVDEEVVFPMGS